MKRIKFLCFITAILFASVVNAQRKDLNGQLISNDEVDGLHIQNRTAAKFTISNDDGSFVIPAKVSDTLIISGVKYKKQEVIITASIIELGQFSVQLVEKVNELNEVVVGKILTGSLESDLENSDAEPEINFYDLGIPGSTKIPPTQSERRLQDADHGKFVYYYGLGIVINVHKILNRINGDTEEYKVRIITEFNDKCINRLKDDYSKTIFEAIEIPKKSKEEFFQFCIEDDQFNAICADGNTINDVSFMLDKLKIFKIRLDGED